MHLHTHSGRKEISSVHFDDVYGSAAARFVVRGSERLEEEVRGRIHANDFRLLLSLSAASIGADNE